MKKSLLLISLGCLLAGACSTEEIANNGEGTTHQKHNKASYLTVRLQSPSGMSTRAEAPGGDVDGKYKDGNKEENNVSQVRFYFFDEDGEPIMVRVNPANSAEFFSYYDWLPSEDSQSYPDDVPGDNGAHDGTIEKTLQTTLTLAGPEGEELPDLMVAVLNPSPEVLAINNPTLDMLNGTNLGNSTEGVAPTNCIYDFWTGLHDNNFVMSNSVYAGTTDLNESTTSEINYAVVKGHTYESLTDAQADPVKVYVERVLARLDFSIADPDAYLEDSNIKIKPVKGKNNVFDTGVTYKYKNDGKDDGPVYVKLLGWTITSTPNKSRLVKKINVDWKKDLFGDTWLWNTADYHRSFWAVNPLLLWNSDADETDYIFYSYNDISPNGKASFTFPELGKYSTHYMQENAAYNEETGEGAKYPTAVIMVGQLVQDDGETPVSLLEWANEKYTETGLLNHFANYMNVYYYNTTATGEDKYEKISSKDLTFVTYKKFNGPEKLSPDEVEEGYTVYCVLNGDAEKKSWYLKQEDGSYKNFNSATDVNTYIYNQYESASPVLYWKEGRTYYYFNIRHLGASGTGIGYYGVVRNHIYDSLLTDLGGLGTPVYDPNEEIFPEEVDRNKKLIAVQINILQWRVVSQKYEVNW